MTELNYDLIPEELKQELIKEACRKGSKLALLGDGIDFHNFQKLCLSAYKAASQQTKKPVDMSVLVNSGVLCEFSNSDDFNWSCCEFLVKTAFSCGLYDYSAKDGRVYTYCRPLYGYWHSANNFDRADILANKLNSAGFKVEWDGLGTSFRITGMQDDYFEPWRCG